MTCEVEASLIKRGVILSLIRFIISVLAIAISFILPIIIFFIYNIYCYGEQFDFKESQAIIVGIATFISILLGTQLVHYILGYRETQLTIENDIYFVLQYKNKIYRFNILEEHNRNNLKLYVYSYSKRGKIRIKSIYNNKKMTIISKDLYNKLISISDRYSIGLKLIDDTPQD